MAERKTPTISVSRAAEIFGEIVSIRRCYAADHEFFRMEEVWRDLAGESFDDEGGEELPLQINIKEYESPANEDYKRKAAIIAFGNRATVVVDQRMMTSARKGDGLDNFILAHEFAHMALEHHAQFAAIRNFMLSQTSNGGRVIPPDEMELEANFAAVLFLCGPSILEKRADARSLAKKASCDLSELKKVLSYLKVEELRRTIEKARSGIERVIL